MRGFMSAGMVNELVACVLRDGHRVLNQTSHADGRDFYRIQVHDRLFAVTNLEDYERILVMQAPEPVQMRLFGEMA
jgi:hypothetical protein